MPEYQLLQRHVVQVQISLWPLTKYFAPNNTANSNFCTLVFKNSLKLDVELSAAKNHQNKNIHADSNVTMAVCKPLTWTGLAPHFATSELVLLLSREPKVNRCGWCVCVLQWFSALYCVAPICLFLTQKRNRSNTQLLNVTHSQSGDVCFKPGDCVFKRHWSFVSRVLCSTRFLKHAVCYMCNVLNWSHAVFFYYYYYLLQIFNLFQCCKTP